MNQFIITSKKINGQIGIAFNDRGTVVKIDMTAAEMDVHTTAHFLRTVPVSEANLGTSFSADVTIVGDSFKVSFDEFWTAYNKKINRKRCLPLWDKMTITNKVKAFYGIRDYDKFLGANKRIKCDPENYLRNEMWENEYK